MKFFGLYILLASALISSDDLKCKQGLEGHLYLKTGNQMPSPDLPPQQPRGIKTQLYVYELTNLKDVARQGESAFYSSVSTKLVKEVNTDEKGYFKVALEPGFYSLFVKKGELFYSNLFDGSGNIHPVEVKAKKITEVVFNVDYDAVY